MGLKPSGPTASDSKDLRSDSEQRAADSDAFPTDQAISDTDLAAAVRAAWPALSTGARNSIIANVRAVHHA